MFQNKNIAKLFLYIIFLIVFCGFLVFPIYYQYVGSYSAPTSVYSVNIVNTGSLGADNYISSLNTRGNSDVNLEADYPLPSIALAMLTLVTGIPQSYLMVIPISGLAGMMYFILARRILNEKKNGNFFALFFSIIYFIFMMCSRLDGISTGRAVLGVAMLPYFIFSLTMFLHKSISRKGQLNSWFILSCIFAISSGYTYYTSNTVIIFLSLAIALFAFSWSFFKKKMISHVGLALSTLSIFLFTLPGYLVSIIGKFDFNSFLDNLSEYMMMKLTGESAQLRRLDYSGLINVDWLTIDLRFISSLIIIFSIIMPPLAIIIFKSKRKDSVRLVWLFSIIALLAGLSEFGYIFETQAFPTRFFVMFGLIIMPLAVWEIINKITLRYSSKFPFRKVVFVFLALFLLAGAMGALRYNWYYGQGAAKPFSYNDVEPLGVFVCTYSSDRIPIVLSGDAGYSANIFFMASIYNKTNAVISQPLGQDTITLYNWTLDSSNGKFFENMGKRGIDYLFILNKDYPIWGADWGYVVPIPNSRTFNLDLNHIYDNGWSKIYGILH